MKKTVTMTLYNTCHLEKNFTAEFITLTFAAMGLEKCRERKPDWTLSVNKISRLVKCFSPQGRGIMHLCFYLSVYQLCHVTAI